jgi:hypothetical protein
MTLYLKLQLRLKANYRVSTDLQRLAKDHASPNVTVRVERRRDNKHFFAAVGGKPGVSSNECADGG